MTRYNTGNPVPSADPRDASDNANVFDEFVNSDSQSTSNRLGQSRRTISGLESEIQARIDSALANYATLTNRGDWTTSTAYNEGDLWRNVDTWYLVPASYTSGASAAADIANGDAIEYTNVNRVQNVVSTSDMQLVPVIYNSQSVYLSDGVRSGGFSWDDSDLSDYVSIDAFQGVYVAPSSDPTGASGCWVRDSIKNYISTNMFGVPADGSNGNIRIQAAYALSVFMDVAFKYDAGSYLQDTLYRKNSLPILSSGKTNTIIRGLPGKDVFSWDNSASRERVVTGAEIEPMTIFVDGSTDTRDTIYADRCNYSGDNIGPIAISRGDPDLVIDNGILNNSIGGCRIQSVADATGTAATNCIHNGTNIENGLDVQSLDFGIFDPVYGCRRVSSVSSDTITIDAAKLAEIRTRQDNPLAIGDSVCLIFNVNDNPAETERPNTRYLISAITPTTITVTTVTGDPIVFSTSPSPCWLVPSGAEGAEAGADGAVFNAPKLTTNKNGFSFMDAIDMKWIAPRHFYRQHFGDLLNGEYFGDNIARAAGLRNKLGPMYCEGPFDNSYSNKSTARLENNNCELDGLWIANLSNVDNIHIDLSGSNCVANRGLFFGGLRITGDNNEISGAVLSPSVVDDQGVENVFIQTDDPGTSSTLTGTFPSQLTGLLNDKLVNSIGSLGKGDIDNISRWTPKSYSNQGGGVSISTDPTADYSQHIRSDSESALFATRRVNGQPIKTGVNIAADLVVLTARVRSNTATTAAIGVQSIGGNTVPYQQSSPVSVNPGEWVELNIVADLSAATYDSELQINIIFAAPGIIDLNWIKSVQMLKAVSGDKIVTHRVIALSPDGTLYELTPPNGGGAAAWVAYSN